MAGTNCGIATRMTHPSLGSCLAEKGPQGQAFLSLLGAYCANQGSYELGCIAAVGKSKLNILMINETI